jgi:hypothetical protein
MSASLSWFEGARRFVGPRFITERSPYPARPRIVDATVKRGSDELVLEVWWSQAMRAGSVAVETTWRRGAHEWRAPATACAVGGRTLTCRITRAPAEVDGEPLELVIPASLQGRDGSRPVGWGSALRDTALRL